jgi:hypothetical protein
MALDEVKRPRGTADAVVIIAVTVDDSLGWYLGLASELGAGHSHAALGLYCCGRYCCVGDSRMSARYMYREGFLPAGQMDVSSPSWLMTAR